MKLLQIISRIFNLSDENKNKKNVNIAVFLLFSGIILIALSSFSVPAIPKKEKSEEISISDIRSLEEKRLEKVLEKVSGVKNVTVMISYKNSGILEALTEEKTILKNSKSINEINNAETQTERKPVYDGNKNIITKTQFMPEIKGVCIFYSGEKSEETENKLYRAVKGALGIELYKAEVIHTDN